MTTRGFHVEDVEQLRTIHERYYKEEFEFPDFFNKFLCAYTVLDEKEKILAAGGVRNLAEVVLITNKDIPFQERIEALYRVFDSSAFVAGHFGHTQIHAFVQDQVWEQYLIKVGFKPCKGRPYYLDLGVEKNGQG